MSSVYQASLFDDTELTNIVNVARVPQRSPFRYAGGKTWLVPRIRQWLASRPSKPAIFIEPFAGGGIVSLTVAFEELADHVLMVELDEEVAAVWQTIITDDGGGQWLADRIEGFDLREETLREVLAQSGSQTSTRDLSFRTILKNRVNRGGILAPGAGLIKNGENGKGLQSRWYPETLARRIREIVQVKDRISFLHGDGLQALREHADRNDAAYFIDPPYTAAGKKAGSRLYTHSDLDHQALFKLAAKVKGDFLITYDNADELRALAQHHHFDCLLIAMKNTHHAKMNELLIGRNLDWARS